MAIQLPHNWAPRSYQQALWNYLWSGGRRASAVWHRRAGKDEVCLHWAAVSAHARKGNYWHMLPQAKQARKALWDSINPHTGLRRIDEAFPISLRAATREQEMQIVFKNGSTWQVLGSDNYNALVGSPPVGLVFSEWALADPSAWALLRPILLENQGWALFIGTPRGHNHAKRTHDLAMKSSSWFGQLLTVENTGVFTEADLKMEMEELVEQYGEEIGTALYEQEYHCFPPGTGIWTPQGNRPIEDIRVGDMVLGHSGRFRAVKKLYQHQHDGEMVHIRAFGNPTPLICTPNHPVRVCDPSKQTYGWKPAGEITSKDYVVLPRMKPGVPVIAADLAELIAWFIAEGSTAKTAATISLNQTEVEYASRVEKAAAPYAKTNRVTTPTTLSVHLKSAQLAEFLKVNCGANAATKRIPWDLISGHEQRVFDTLMVGDGCWGDYGQVKGAYTTVSEQLARDVQALAHGLGWTASITRKSGYVGTFMGIRKIECLPSYAVRLSHNSRGKGKRLKPQKHGVAARVWKTWREPYSGPVHNLHVQYDESYVAQGMQVHNCSFNAAILGAYFSKEMRTLRLKNRIREDLDFIPGLPVHTWWDLGINDPTSIVFMQFDGPRVLIQDYYENTGASMADYARVLEDKRREHRIVYGAHIGPHDLRKREFSGQRVKDLALDLGIDFEVSPKLPKADSIQHVRRMLPRCWFNATRCEHLINALEQHHAEYNEKTRTFNLNPVHDWTSHPVDAFKYGAQAPSYFFTTTWENDAEDEFSPGSSVSRFDEELDRCAI